MRDLEREEIKTFTLSEARRLLPQLRRLLARVTVEREAILDLRMEMERVREKASLDSGSPYGTTYIAHMTAFTEAVQRIQSLGVEIKDFRSGLIDFPHERDGRIVFLCWKMDEEEINWWHEIDAGFAGRQMLTDDFD
ncbi:MAG: DUF2203 domain-containing protein [Acidobacteriota bacterium]